MNTPLVDAYGRTVRYLRLSVTDRCNLRCIYCTNAEALPFIPHEAILTYEEMLTLITAAVELGIDKVRLTGGEPFARKGFISFLEQARTRHPALDLRITTNATLLAQYMPALKALGLNALNISFDTFSPVVFKQITGVDAFAAAQKGLYAALESGIPIKINAVALKGINDSALPEFIAFAKKHPVDLRFIEHMPLGGKATWTKDNFWSAQDILAKAQEYAELTPVEKKSNAEQSGPARLFTIKDGLGRFGLITPLSNHFCGSCNRLRITSDGRLRTCLFSDTEYPFMQMLRDPTRGIQAVKELMRTALKDKPLGYALLENKKNAGSVIQRSMSAIGG